MDEDFPAEGFFAAFFFADAFFFVDFFLLGDFFAERFALARFRLVDFFFDADFFREAFFFREVAVLRDDFLAATFFLVTLRLLAAVFFRVEALFLDTFFREAFAALRLLLADFFAGIWISCRSEKNAQLYIAGLLMEARNSRILTWKQPTGNGARTVCPGADDERRMHWIHRPGTQAVGSDRQSFYVPNYITLARFYGHGHNSSRCDLARSSLPDSNLS